MQEVQDWHRKFFRTLEKHHATFCPSYFGIHVGEHEFHCFCGGAFTTAQGLATHRRKAHDVFSLEHDLLTGATCPVCLRHFWNTQRLQQHLSYISRKTGRNACYQTLRKTGYSAAYERAVVPGHLQGVNRLEAIRSEGPMPCFEPRIAQQIEQWKAEVHCIITIAVASHTVP